MSQTTIEKHSSAKSSGLMTYEEFLAADFDNPHVEWVNGRVVEMAPVSDEHMDLGGLLEAVLRAFVEEKKLGVIRHDPFQMKLGGDLPGRAPDILFLATRHKSRLKKTHVKGAADMVVEIISPDGRGRDRGEKFYEYEEGGVPEYWLIDPERKQAEFYLRNKRGNYEPAPLDAKGIFHSCHP
jgi:Uma2 family endonuclease